MKGELLILGALCFISSFLSRHSKTNKTIYELLFPIKDNTY